MTRRHPAAAALLAGVLLLGGCTGGGEPRDATGTMAAPTGPTASPGGDATAACHRVTTRLLAAVQAYVDSYGAPLTTSKGRRPRVGGASGDDRLQRALSKTQTGLQGNNCDVAEFQQDFRSGLSRVRAPGPVAHAVLLRLTASMTGATGRTRSTRTVRPGQDLGKALAELAPGSVLKLGAGHHRLDEPLVLLQGVTLRGSGERRTTITSSAAGNGVLVLTDGRVELADLALRHRGHKAATLLMAGPTSSVVLTDVRLTGARSDKHGEGGSAVVMTARDGRAGGRGTTLEITGADLSGNDAAGVLLSGRHRASIHRTRFTDNGQCGVCFADQSSGAVRDSRFTDNAVGVAVLDRAAPALVGNIFTGGQVAVQASGRAAPLLRDSTINGSRRAAVIFSGRSSGRVFGTDCQGVPYGIVVSPKAYPYLGKNSCQLAQGS